MRQAENANHLPDPMLWIDMEHSLYLLQWFFGYCERS